MNMKHLVNLNVGLSVLALVSSLGCDGFQPEASKGAAQAHFEEEIEKWMSGQRKEAPTMKLRLKFAMPIAYDIRSVVGAKANLFAGENVQDFPAFQINTVMVWESDVGTPLETVEQFNLTWNPHEKKWYLADGYVGQLR